MIQLNWLEYLLITTKKDLLKRIRRRKTAIKKSLDFYLKRMKYVEDPVKVPLFLSEKDAETTKQCINSVEKSQPMLNYLRPKGIASDPEVFQ